MPRAMGDVLRQSVTSVMAATLLATSAMSATPAFAFSLLNDAVKQAPAAPREKPVLQALEAPSKGIPMPDPLVNSQAAPSTGDSAPASGTPTKSVEFLFDINKAPDAVRKLREAIVEAAASGDPERLRPLMNVGGGLNQTQVTADDPGEDPIKSLHDLSGDKDGIEVMSILLDLLSTGFAHVGQGTPNEMYVWPYFAEKDIKTLTAPEKVDLMRIVTAGDYSDMLEFGGYNFYRVGITPDGKWKFFSASE
ncbi:MULTISPECIES: hypothetical protein [Rhizobium]|uniref:Uncharacterized protein n=1 Tax=Rhizobium rhododendri TaxID=2506430 RepID=A0ABY8IJT1_9HYPH|nr:MULTISPECIES: hypothetical protein [Rhizobium]MBZ5760197.1 hypothetical protein [Rhizobium sp. VS19-DR96]MBZ5766322.1 hypothetical protein [Rhizobium sp. VS19-DR129.2]MBZ5774335.1 hypothetical protein [Rhizobium sp. VS19-DRK62.2]MBZ5785408.1 hypothetical protein [Rhizobium sp. VS19-DR121]MBZ5803006.1 hypothetical protein [Rhizobium sp. VS19-DR181]